MNKTNRPPPPRLAVAQRVLGTLVGAELPWR